MDHDFWHNKWEKGEIGFHEEEINKHLKRYWYKLGLRKKDSVFVPFCGKSRDMLWLAEQGHSVLGVELSPIAVEAFFRENNLKANRKMAGNFSLWECESIKILCGDFFNLKKDALRGVNAVYDRAALVALSPNLRLRYARHLMKLLPSEAKVFLVSLEYTQDEMKGPPFSVSEKEINEIYENDWDITRLMQKDILEKNLHFKDRGLTQLQEKVYLITRT